MQHHFLTLLASKTLQCLKNSSIFDFAFDLFSLGLCLPLVLDFKGNKDPVARYEFKWTGSLVVKHIALQLKQVSLPVLSS